MTASPERGIQFNFNTVILAITLGVTSWVGFTVQSTSVAIAVITERNTQQERQLLDLRTRVAQIEMQLARIQRQP